MRERSSAARFLTGAALKGLLAHPFILILAMPGLARAQGYSPAEAVRHMTVPAGFEVKCFAGEPTVRQPVCIEFDDRGRLWVVQYLQYPNPAELKRVKVDRYSRTVYDRVPEPPPRGPKGADRITILEDTDGDGRADRAKDFVTGLNLASGIAFGHGGVFVLQVPYLLFYPDRDGNDVPDADPQVLLSGFGMEDASAVANSLTWGPDGWLYGAQGTTVTANIRGIEFQQGVWRYHPLTKQFELFFEGGGNMWGLDFDARGRLLASTNLGPYVMLHGAQGAYYWKQFGKHGALHNPYTFGYFDHVDYSGFHGGHVTAGGIVYQGDSFPSAFRGKYVAANVLGHAIYWHDLEPLGSTFKADHGGELLAGNDTWFAPDDLTSGPDGSVFVADWCDKRTAHPDPDADWDLTNGRIYKIQAQGVKPVQPRDLTQLTSDELLPLLDHPNDWYARKARRILADRRDDSIFPALRKLVLKRQDEHALQPLWALYVSCGFDEALAEQLLSHADANVRAWTVRFLGDEGRVSPAIGRRLTALARNEANVSVRGQLACSAKRLPVADGLPIVRAILQRNEDGRDPHIPLLLWWAVEQFTRMDSGRVIEEFTSTAAWNAPMIRDVILGRLVKRCVLEGGDAGYSDCARLLTSAPSPADRELLIDALDEATQGLRLEKVPPALEKPLAALWGQEPAENLALLRVAARLGSSAAHDRAMSWVKDAQSPEKMRRAALTLLGEVGRPEDVTVLLKCIAAAEPQAVQSAALDALRRFPDDSIATALLQKYSQMNVELRSQTRDLLFSRKPWAIRFLKKVDERQFAAEEVTPEQLRVLASFEDQKIDALLHQHWGTLRAGTPEEKLADIRRFNNDLRAAPGKPENGRLLFNQLCATCHRLFDEGHVVGPDLTHANRQDRDFLLVSLVDPSLIVRKEYMSYIVETNDGRTLNGLLVEQTPTGITLLAADAERTRIARSDISEIRESQISLMPEDQLNKLTPDQLRDLFAYLQRAP